MQNPDIRPGGGLFGGNLLSLKTHPSSNQWMLEHADDCTHGDVLIVQNQTDGRGRLQRSWLAAADQTLCLSIFLNAPTFEQHPERCGMAAALAIHDTLSDLSIASQLKWPNDVWVTGRKISGILLEGRSNGVGCVLGIGLNVAVPKENLDAAGFDHPATSILAELNGHPPIDEVWELLRNKLSLRLPQVDPSAWPQLLNDWRSADALLDTQLTLMTPTGPVQGAYRGIDPTGALSLATDAGLQTFLAGDIQRVRPAT